ncbi:MAG: DUF3300 domain-containing protein [Candidatus Binataceae bacterium]
MLIAKRRGQTPKALISGSAALFLLFAQLSSAVLAQESPGAPNAAPPGAAKPGPPPGEATPQQLQQLVSPIALYPDLMVAQILTASTYPTQIVEADRWLQDNKNLKGQQLADAVDAQPWDPSVRSLTAYPPVLDNLSQNLSWTSSLGEAYYNQPADVMKAIQTLRGMAVKSGTLKSTPQQKVTVQSSSGGTSAPPTVVTEGGSTVVTESGSGGNQVIVIQPAQPDVVYVPQYNPTTAYGAPMAAPPGYSSEDLLLTGLLSFGAGMLVGSLINSGSNHWGCNWGGGTVNYNKNVYVSNSNAVPSRWGYGNHPYNPNQPYHPYSPNQPYHPNYGYGGYPRPNMPSSYDQSQYKQDWQNAKNNPQYQKDWQNAKNNPQYQKDYQNAKTTASNDAESHGWSKSPSSTPSSSNKSASSDNSSRGWGDQDKQSSQHSWGGQKQPGGFTQAASKRGQQSFGGGNRRFGGGDRRF